MANDDYGIISAHSATGDDLNIPIAWTIDNPLTDLKVLVVGFDGGVGEVSVCDYWIFNAQTSVLSVPNELDFLDWYAYVFRVEAAEMLSALTSGAEVRVGDIIAQLTKNVRVLEQLQASEDVSLRAVDAITPLANAVARAGKVLAFDADGNPDLTLAKEDVQGAYDARDEAVAAKNTAVAAKNTAVEKAAAASASASTASAKATIAGEKADAAAGSASTANTKASEAAASSSLAKKWASENEDVVVADGKYSAKHYAAKSAAKAQDAATSAQDAANADN